MSKKDTKRQLTPEQMSKKILELENTVKNIEQEVNLLRGLELNMNRLFKSVGEKLSQLDVNLVWHTHQETRMAGPMMFRREDFERATGMKVDDNMQIHPPPQRPNTVQQDEEDGE